MKGGRQGWRKDEARGATGSASLKPPCCCCWREISRFYFHPRLFAISLLSPGFPISICLPCVCVACALWCFPSFVFFPFISPSYHFSLLFSLSGSINYLSYVVPYLPHIAPVDLLSKIPSLTRIGSCGSNRVPVIPAAVRIKVYLPSSFQVEIC